MIQPRYYVVQKFDKRSHETRYHVAQAAGVSIADFSSLVEAAVVSRYLSMDAITYDERKIAVRALKQNEAYGITESLDIDNLKIPDEEGDTNDG